MLSWDLSERRRRTYKDRRRNRKDQTAGRPRCLKPPDLKNRAFVSLLSCGFQARRDVVGSNEEKQVRRKQGGIKIKKKGKKEGVLKQKNG